MRSQIAKSFVRNEGYNGIGMLFWLQACKKLVPWLTGKARIRDDQSEMPRTRPWRWIKCSRTET